MSSTTKIKLTIEVELEHNDSDSNDLAHRFVDDCEYNFEFDECGVSIVDTEIIEFDIID